MLVPHIDCTVSFVRVFGVMVNPDSEDITILAKEFERHQQVLMSKLGRDAYDIEKVVLYYPEGKQGLYQTQILRSNLRLSKT